MFAAQELLFCILLTSGQGIGYAIVRNLALQYPKSSFNHGPFLVYLTARNQERGEEAVQNLHKDDQLAGAKALSDQGGLTDIKYHTLDISQTKSIQEFRDFIKQEHPDGIDILVNNAGIALDGFSKSIPMPSGTLPLSRCGYCASPSCLTNHPHLPMQITALSRKRSNQTTTAPSKCRSPSSPS